MTNTFDALMMEVNSKISEADKASSQANAAVALANEAANHANEKAQAAADAAQEADEAAQSAREEADAWENAIVKAKTAQAGSEAGVTLTREDGVNGFEFVIPCGMEGAKGEKGDPGRSGVTFTLSGTSLYITTD